MIASGEVNASLMLDRHGIQSVCQWPCVCPVMPSQQQTLAWTHTHICCKNSHGLKEQKSIKYDWLDSQNVFNNMPQNLHASLVWNDVILYIPTTYDNTCCITNWKKYIVMRWNMKLHAVQQFWHRLQSWFTLQWRQNGHDDVSYHKPHHCLLNCLFGRRSKKTSKLCVTGLCVGNSPGTGEFPAQMASNADNDSIWWRHHEWQETPMI